MSHIARSTYAPSVPSMNVKSEGGMEFKSYDDMLKFERERGKYYMDFIHLCDSFDPLRIRFYKRLFTDTFTKSGRAQKKMFDGYMGGWWRNECGHPCAKHIELIDLDAVAEGEICIEIDGDALYGLYLKWNNTLQRIDPEFAKAYERKDIDGNSQCHTKSEFGGR